MWLKMKKKSIVVLLIISFIIVITSSSMASSPIENPDSFKPTLDGDTTLVTEKANNIIGAIVTVGVIVSVITLIVLGIKYMMGSVEEKADYKKSMLPYLVGTIFLFSASVVVGIIANLVQELNL